MLNLKNSDMESLLFEYVDKVKAVVSDELWADILLNSTKNEVFILILLYRSQEVNMTQIAEYVNVPLNTATGIAARMEKRGWIRRDRSQEDKRVVTIALTEQGQEHMNKVLNEFIRYGSRIIQELSEQEMELLNHLFDKIIGILNDEQKRNSPAAPKRVKRITIE